MLPVNDNVNHSVVDVTSPNSSNISIPIDMPIPLVNDHDKILTQTNNTQNSGTNISSDVKPSDFIHSMDAMHESTDDTTSTLPTPTANSNTQIPIQITPSDSVEQQPQFENEENKLNRIIQSIQTGQTVPKFTMLAVKPPKPPLSHLLSKTYLQKHLKQPSLVFPSNYVSTTKKTAGTPPQQVQPTTEQSKVSSIYSQIPLPLHPITKQIQYTPPFILTTPKYVSKPDIPPLDIHKEMSYVNVSNSPRSANSSLNTNEHVGSIQLITHTASIEPEIKQNTSVIPETKTLQVTQHPIESHNVVKQPLFKSQQVKPTKAKKKPDWERLKQLSKTNESCQQAVFIGLLNQLGYEIGIERVYKISRKTFPLLTLHYVNKHTEEGVIDMKIISNAREMSEKKLSVSSAEDKKKRRQHKRNMDASMCNMLLEYLEQENVTFEVKGTRSAQFTMIMKKIKSIELFLHGKRRRIKQSDIVNIGKHINNHLVKMMSGMKRRSGFSEKFIRVLPFETSITGILISHFNGLLETFDDCNKCVDIDGECIIDNTQHLAYHSLPLLKPRNSIKTQYDDHFYSFIDPQLLNFFESELP
ncbi:Uncharacterized protein QTN25_003478 [Entamoeba marina]